MKKLYRIKNDRDIVFGYRGMLCYITDTSYIIDSKTTVTLELICSSKELDERNISRHPRCRLKYLEPVNLKNNYYTYNHMYFGR